MGNGAITKTKARFQMCDDETLKWQTRNHSATMALLAKAYKQCQ